MSIKYNTVNDSNNNNNNNNTDENKVQDKEKEIINNLIPDGRCAIPSTL